ncbi:MAG: hypothetical protein SWZ49_27335, partial [Cyanobacteriota bacterium]|nr:hypothetical protein [Cyanobacteriota bacterium]
MDSSEIPTSSDRGSLKAKSTISNTTFVDNYADRQAGNIWTAGKKQGENLTITNSRFAGNRSPQFNGKSERTVNFEVTDGGGNIVQNKNGADKSIAGAKFVEDLELDVNPVPQNEGNLEPLRYEAEELTLDGYKVE